MSHRWVRVLLSFSAGIAGVAAVGAAPASAAPILPRDVGSNVQEAHAPGCLFQKGEIVTVPPLTQEQINKANDALHAQGFPEVTLYKPTTTVTATTPSARYRFVPTADPLAVSNIIETALGNVRVAPNYAVAFTPGWKFSPDGAPQSVATAPTLNASLATKSKPVVGIIDTGLDASAWPLSWPRPTLLAPKGDLKSGVVAGHGTFVAGVVVREAPGLRVLVDNPWAVGSFPTVTLDGSGPLPVTNDVDVAAAIMRMAAQDIDVLNLSMGTYACSDVKSPARGAREPIATRAALLYLHSVRPEVVVTAAAGNDGVSTAARFYPAAYAPQATFADWVISVGTTGGYSNYGDWVVASARGTGVINRRSVQTAPNTLAAGTYRWSGTSFAAPCLAAKIATKAAGSGLTAHQTWKSMKNALSLARVPVGSGAFLTGVGFDEFVC
jgi:hypothetical protein